MSESQLQEILSGCLNSQRKEQRMLYEAFAGKMMAVCRRYCRSREEAEDALSTGFIKVFKNISQYSGTGSFEGWMRRIMVRTALDQTRKRRLEVPIGEISDFFSVPQPVYYDPSDLTVKEILRLLDELPDYYRLVFTLNAIEGYSHREIADHLNISELSSRTLLHRARTMLKARVSAMENPPVLCSA